MKAAGEKSLPEESGKNLTEEYGEANEGYRATTVFGGLLLKAIAIDMLTSSSSEEEDEVDWSRDTPSPAPAPLHAKEEPEEATEAEAGTGEEKQGLVQAPPVSPTSPSLQGPPAKRPWHRRDPLPPWQDKGRQEEKQQEQKRKHKKEKKHSGEPPWAKAASSSCPMRPRVPLQAKCKDKHGQTTSSQVRPTTAPTMVMRPRTPPRAPTRARPSTATRAAPTARPSSAYLEVQPGGPSRQQE